MERNVEDLPPLAVVPVSLTLFVSLLLRVVACFVTIFSLTFFWSE